MENRRPEMTETARRAIGALSRIGRALAVPPLGAATASALVSAVLLIWTFTGGPDRTGHPVAYLSYLLSAYALVVWCIRIARAKPVRRVGDALRANRHAARLLDDAHHRLGVSTALSFGVDLIWTLGNAYAAATQRSMWFCTLAVYYAALCLMRLPLSVAILRSSGTSSDARESGIGYRLRRICGITLAACSIVFTGFVVLAIHREGAFSYRGSLLLPSRSTPSTPLSAASCAWCAPARTRDPSSPRPTRSTWRSPPSRCSRSRSPCSTASTQQDKRGSGSS